MRTTVTIDDSLYQRALELAEPGMDRADIFQEAMKVFVRIQSAKRLAALGGAAPYMSPIGRRTNMGDSPASAQSLSQGLSNPLLDEAETVVFERNQKSQRPT